MHVVSRESDHCVHVRRGLCRVRGQSAAPIDRGAFERDAGTGMRYVQPRRVTHVCDYHVARSYYTTAVFVAIESICPGLRITHRRTTGVCQSRRVAEVCSGRATLFSIARLLLLFPRSDRSRVADRS